MKYLFLVLILFSLWQSPAKAMGYYPGYCGSVCMAQMNQFCPYCEYGYRPANTMPWGVPAPYYWNTGPMMYSNYYAPAPWYYAPMPQYNYPNNYPSPGIIPNYYPGQGSFFAAKPNLYLEGKEGTKVNIKLEFLDKDTNWLAAIPVHGKEGWNAVIAKKGFLTVNDTAYAYLYSDYRSAEKYLQDQEGFCSKKDAVLGRMALEMKSANFSEPEIAQFLEYWTVKLPKSESYCVYPQDERQLDKIAKLEISPAPKAVRRLIFLVQVKEGLRKNGGKFTKEPSKTWTPTAFRLPAAEEKDAFVVREWGVGFLASKP